jgi:hypothetical protein
MKKLSVIKIKKQLKELDADDASRDLIISTVEHHNDLVDDYNNDDKHQQYLCYQLKQQLFKMIQDLKKQNKKNGNDEPEEDTFQTVIAAIKNTKENINPIGFAVNKKDCEKR